MALLRETVYKSANAALTAMGDAASRLSERIRLAHCDLNKNPWAEEKYQIKTFALLTVSLGHCSATVANTHRRDPTFLAFKNGTIVSRMSGVQELVKAIRGLLGHLSSGSSSGASGASSSGGAGAGAEDSNASHHWLGAVITAKNYSNITSNIENTRLDILNANAALGGPRTLFEGTKPSALDSKGKGKAESKGDWVESDTDEQLMLFVPFQSAVKLHSIQITSLPPPPPPSDDGANDDDDDDDYDDDDDELPSRPKTIKLFCNTHHILGFDDAEDRTATQVVELKPEDWNADGTTVVATKFVKFQSCSDVTIFFLNVEREGGEKVRVDRLRMVGEVMAEKVDMTKLKQEE